MWHDIRWSPRDDLQPSSGLLMRVQSDNGWQEERLEVRAEPYCLGRMIARYSTSGDLTMRIEESEYAL